MLSPASWRSSVQPSRHAARLRLRSLCRLVRAGAGPGGLYTALRLVDTGTVAASDICIFEMSGRVGGRIYSLRGFGPDADLVVDVGAYRSWPEYTPITHALITECAPRAPRNAAHPPRETPSHLHPWDMPRHLLPAS